MREGYEQIVLSDEAVSEARAPIPMILAAGAVHSHLVREGLRSFSSITVRSGECLDVHYVAVLIGVGATAVNPYLAEAAIADRHARGLFPGLTLQECLARYKEAVDQGLLKVMSKMGISILSSYRGGYNFEAVGLSRSLCAEYFPGLITRISGIGLAGIQNKVLALHRPGLRRRQPAARDRRPLPLPPGRRAPRPRGAGDPPAAVRGRDRFLRRLQEIRRDPVQAEADRAPRSARLRPPPGADPDGRGRIRSPRSGSASSRPACRSARCRPRRTRR